MIFLRIKEYVDRTDIPRKASEPLLDESIQLGDLGSQQFLLYQWRDYLTLEFITAM